jgi:diguanylate cyclase (GGDEF)-like protein
MITKKQFLNLFHMQGMAFILALVVAPFLLWLSQQAINELVASRDRIEHTYSVLSKLDNLRSQVETIETARRGYAISPQQEYLQPYLHARKKISSNLVEIKTLVADNPEQLQHLAELSPVIDSLIALAKGDFSTRAMGTRQSIDNLAHAKIITDQARSVIEEMSTHEEILLVERTADSAMKLRHFKGWLIAIGMMFIGLLMFAFIKGYREISQRRITEEKLLQSQAQNEVTVHNLSLMSEMTSLLQACSDADESLDVICQFAARLLPADSGGVYLFRESRNQIELSINWGKPSRSEVIFEQEDCWALRRGETHVLDHGDNSLACRHLHDWANISSLCIPIVAQGNVLGILHLENVGKDIPENVQSLAGNLANQIALAMASIKLRDTLRSLSVRDPLTGLFNRRYMEESLQREIATSQRKSRPLALVILDLDYFKKFNDTFGHEAGDMLLREVGALLARKSRSGDIACRFGGEEFVVIYPEAEPQIATQLANQLREAIHAMQLQHFGRSLGQISASFGLSFFPKHGSSTDELLRAADKALYEAKAAGRNRIAIAS